MRSLVAIMALLLAGSNAL